MVGDMWPIYVLCYFVETLTYLFSFFKKYFYLHPLILSFSHKETPFICKFYESIAILVQQFSAYKYNCICWDFFYI